ncbi:hypothetical protein F53441_5405 [Fusarium austroafricanum]|uniref:Uncharacterized protein n=1 Tax=Fusarium austroafricanum TaxID=2364996 RepID=A0A8H4P0R8_9HYPO|nr:hypothetical protein F53441_5405 [Fusarium austroafricanum]
MAFDLRPDEPRLPRRGFAVAMRLFINETYERRIKACESWNENFPDTEDLRYRILARLDPEAAILEWDPDQNRRNDPSIIRIAAPSNWDQNFRAQEWEEDAILRRQNAIKFEYDLWLRDHIHAKEVEFETLRMEVIGMGLRMVFIKQVEGSDNEEISVVDMLEDQLDEFQRFKSRINYLLEDLRARVPEVDSTDSTTSEGS